MAEFKQPADQELAFLPEFLPDETLYSLCARFHNLSGNRLASTTSHQLFSVGTAGMLHDFPCHLSVFERRTRGTLGDVSYLAHERTLLKFYVPYQPADRITAGVSGMSGSGIGHFKFSLGLPSSRVGAVHPLKACAKCIREETDQLGGAYWHLLHQHPAVYICQKHDDLLMQSTAKSKLHNNLQWLLPHNLEREDWKSLPLRAGPQSRLLIRLSEFAGAVSETADLQFEPRLLRQCYLIGAKESGWLTRNGSVRVRVARQELLDQASELLDIPAFRFIESVSRSSGGFLSKLLHSPRSNLHPTKHLLVKTLLFKNWSEFAQVYAITADLASPRDETKNMRDQSLSEGKQLAAFLADSRMSLASAARELDIPYDRARYCLVRAGIIYRKPEK